MRVIKVLNNSLVLALNDEGQEIILMGKGIGFQKTIGYKLSPKEIDKVFVLKDRELSRRIIRLAGPAADCTVTCRENPDNTEE